MTLIREAHCNTIFRTRPEFLDQAVIEFPGPFATEKGDNLFPAMDEFRSIAPARIRGVGQGDLFGIARIPCVLGKADFLHGSFAGEWRQRRTRGHGHPLPFRSARLLESCNTPDALLRAGRQGVILLRRWLYRVLLGRRGSHFRAGSPVLLMADLTPALAAIWELRV